MFSYLTADLDFFAQAKHHYNFVLVEKGHTIESRVYPSRVEALGKMHSEMRKRGLTLQTVWDDKHDKTYICNDGYEFHINRDC